MSLTLTDTKASVVWGSLRNIVDFDSIRIPSHIRLVGTQMGEFPVDSYHPLFLEVPREREKVDLSSRHDFRFGSKKNSLSGIEWSPRRIVSLPIFDQNDDASAKDIELAFTAMLAEWKRSMIPASIPSVAIAQKARGSYIAEREAQDILVLAIWNDCIARCFYLEWYEGPLEDCISPEWYLRASEFLPLSEAFDIARTYFERPIDWQNTAYSIFVKPTMLGNFLVRGTTIESPYPGWDTEWSYGNTQSFSDDIDRLLSECENLYLN